jgi:hypothetical protein
VSYKRQRSKEKKRIQRTPLERCELFGTTIGFFYFFLILILLIIIRKEVWCVLGTGRTGCPFQYFKIKVTWPNKEESVQLSVLESVSLTLLIYICYETNLNMTKNIEQ